MIIPPIWHNFADGGLTENIRGSRSLVAYDFANFMDNETHDSRRLADQNRTEDQEQ